MAEAIKDPDAVIKKGSFVVDKISNLAFNY